MTDDDIVSHVRAKTLPRPKHGLGVYDAGAQWDQAEVDRALDAVQKRPRNKR
jgi:hypothetical protein